MVLPLEGHTHFSRSLEYHRQVLQLKSLELLVQLMLLAGKHLSKSQARHRYKLELDFKLKLILRMRL